MARKDALIRLYNRLVAQRDDLRQKLAASTGALGEDFGGDSADMAVHEVERELESQLISLESRELNRIERAIEAIRNGTYGQCEHCSERIPVARLQALPHTSCCVDCQRKFESRGNRPGQVENWESAWEYQSREADRDLTLRDIQFETD